MSMSERPLKDDEWCMTLYKEICAPQTLSVDEGMRRFLQLRRIPLNAWYVSLHWVFDANTNRYSGNAIKNGVLSPPQLQIEIPVMQEGERIFAKCCGIKYFGPPDGLAVTQQLFEEAVRQYATELSAPPHVKNSNSRT